MRIAPIESVHRLAPFLHALVVGFDWRRIQSTRALSLFLVFIGIFVGWIEARDLLAGGGRSPFDGTKESSDVVVLFSIMGLAIGLSLAISFPLSRHLLVRVPLAAFVGAAMVALTVEIGTVDRFAPKCSTGRSPCELDGPLAWGLFLGAPLGGSLAFMMHLLRRVSGRFRLTVIALGISLLAAVRSQELFWILWDDRTLPDFPCGMTAEAFLTPGKLLGFLGGLHFCLGVLLLDFGSRLVAPGAFWSLIRRVRISRNAPGRTS